jgi:bidirectional [NiFe] hydrogenase diaphorase subunit
MTRVTVNNMAVDVPEDATVLQAVRAAGIALPTLCYHEGLSPYGACRLCMVSLTIPRRDLIASCIYPVEDGMVVETETPEAKAARRMVLELLLARCPGSGVIRDLAAQMGVTASRFPGAATDGDDERCVLCGLCVRVCHEAIGAKAIGFIGRGEHRKVGSPFEIHSEACIGCGACAEICPTGAIIMEDRGGVRLLSNWHTRIERNPCPDCGRYFAPEKMSFLKEMFSEIESLWTLCPECRSKRTARQWLEEAGQTVAQGNIKKV